MLKLFVPFTTAILLSTATLNAMAAPEAFVYKKPRLGAVSESKMRNVYDLIENRSGSAAKARLAILTAMLNTKGTPWLLLEEGEGYLLARWDYKGHTIFHRIEYNANAIQIKYAGGLNEYECEMLEGDYCYKTHSNYYKYNVSLVTQIKKALSTV
jgi:hypothetical protein